MTEQLPFHQRLCAACGLMHTPLEEMALAPVLPDGTRPPTVFLCGPCRDRVKQHRSFAAQKGLREAIARGVKVGGHRGSTLSPEALVKGRAASVASLARQANARAEGLAPIIAELRAEGAKTLQELANGLTARGVLLPRGGTWSISAVKRVLDRLKANQA